MLNLFIANLKMLIRNKQALFWALMFPLMFTFIFGFFFGKNTNVGNVSVINNSTTELSRGLESSIKDSGIFQVKSEIDLNKAKDEMKKNQTSAILLIPENFGKMGPDIANPTLFYDPANNQVNAALNGFLDKYLTAVNFSAQNIKPIYSVIQEKTNTTKTTTYFDFVLAGILGMALMNSSVNGIAISMTKYREDQILKRIITTPLKTWRFIIAEVLSRLVVNIVQISIIILVGKLFFDAHIYGNLFIVYGMAMIGAILFQLVGFVIASVTKTTDAAEGMATAVTIPMMFLAGVFFPIDSLPKWLYSIVQYLPLAPLLRILRGVVLEANSPFVNPTNIIIIMSWIALCLVFSIFRFKLTEE